MCTYLTEILVTGVFTISPLKLRHKRRWRTKGGLGFLEGWDETGIDIVSRFNLHCKARYSTTKQTKDNWVKPG